MQHPWDWKSNRAYTATGSQAILLLLLYLAVQPVRWEFHFDVSSAAGSGALGSASVFSVISSVSTRNAERAGACGSGVFIAVEADGVEDKGLGDI